MKRFLLLAFAAVILFSCAGKKAEKTAIRDSLMQIHEKVMAVDERATNNHMKLDTLLKQANFADKDTALLIGKKLTAAEDAMSSWMNNFGEKPNLTDEEAIAYLRAQKKLMMAIDSQLNIAVKESDIYLKKVKTK